MVLKHLNGRQIEQLHAEFYRFMPKRMRAGLGKFRRIAELLSEQKRAYTSIAREVGVNRDRVTRIANYLGLETKNPVSAKIIKKKRILSTSPELRRQYMRLRNSGHTVERAAEKIGFTAAAGRIFERQKMRPEERAELLRKVKSRGKAHPLREKIARLLMVKNQGTKNQGTFRYSFNLIARACGLRSLDPAITANIEAGIRKPEDIREVALRFTRMPRGEIKLLELEARQKLEDMVKEEKIKQLERMLNLSGYSKTALERKVAAMAEMAIMPQVNGRAHRIAGTIFSEIFLSPALSCTREELCRATRLDRGQLEPLLTAISNGKTRVLINDNGIVRLNPETLALLERN